MLTSPPDEPVAPAGEPEHHPGGRPGLARAV